MSEEQARAMVDVAFGNIIERIRKCQHRDLDVGWTDTDEFDRDVRWYRARCKGCGIVISQSVSGEIVRQVE